jgi:hypothetical protein
MRFAYADPPYLGCAQRLYGDPTYDSLDAHANLLARLVCEFSDGWAYSLTSTTLQTILAVAPLGVRVGAWVKPFCVFKPNVNPAYAWEPVLFMGGRKRDRTAPPVRDWVSANITLKRGLTGAKPDPFSLWLFDLLGMQAGDEFVDVFPGTGAVSNAWRAFQEAA